MEFRKKSGFYDVVVEGDRLESGRDAEFGLEGLAESMIHSDGLGATP